MKKKSLSAKKKIHSKLLIHLKNQKISKIYEEFDNFVKLNFNKFNFPLQVPNVFFSYHEKSVEKWSPLY